MTLFGWDASDFDHSRGSMDMRAAIGDGLSFFTHKATEGASVVHHPGAALAGARDAGCPFLGVYMVPRTGPSPAAQVDFLLSWMENQAPWWKTFPGWFWQMDTEKWSYDAVSPQIGHACAQILEQRTGKAVLHYAPKWAYGNSVPAGEPLWASSYASGSGNYRSIYPGDGSGNWAAYSGRTPAILQFTSSATLAVAHLAGFHADDPRRAMFDSVATVGLQPGVDINAFRGTVSDFAALIGAGATPLAPTGAPDMQQFLARRTGDGQLFICDGQLSRPVAVGDLGAIQALVAKSKISPVAGIGVGNGAFFPLDGWTEGSCGALMQTAAGPTDAQIQAEAGAIATALIASNANGLTPDDHAALRADIIAVLGTLRVG